MLEPRYRWVFPAFVTPSGELLATGRELGLSERVTGILATRGIADPSELRAFLALEPPLHDPALLPDADRLRERLDRARVADEPVLVFGDFDADGLTGLAIMVIALRGAGHTVEPYVPSRLDEGHGLSLAAVERAAAIGARVIVTVDCGSTSNAEIAAAAERGIDTIVTDHHRVPAVMPPAVALVNPHRPDSVYPDRRLAGSGVAFKVAQLLLGDDALDLADLATIGTVADVAPILGENRAIARLGLALLRTNPRPGIAALLARAGIAPARVDLEQVAFAIAPRLNAAGRMGEALDAADLLLSDDADEAARLAEALEVANSSRRDLMKLAVEEARAAVAAAAEGQGTAPAAVVVRGAWPVGIVGLVAARLAEDSGRPAVVGADLGEVVRASCRSGDALDLAATLEHCADLFIRHGGHAGAAGFELTTDRWDAFRERFLLLAAVAAPPDPLRPLRVDIALPAKSADYALFRELTAFAPTGPGNPDPLVAVCGLTVTRVRAATGGHTQLTLRREVDVLDGIAFGRADLVEIVHEGDRVDVVARLASRSFGGFESLQLEIRDVAPAGSHPETALGAASGGARTLTGAA